MLNLVRMELRGFKSFADKVVIPFNEGVTAIIGPNGCGKSNVADAIRWTLGEGKPKQLRGKQMTDVIFAGTETRKSLSYCEVSLVFNNENRHIFDGLTFEEVVITRKMDRSGKSEYFINNNRCTRKAIYDLFNDTGVGKDGYSIIGQGKVAEIMSAKPDERRHIFEEAAGISGIRNSRADSERKLEKTKLNMQTADEVIAEINRHLGPLRKQAETAQKYFELKDQLKQLEVNYYIYSYENTQQIKQNILDQITALKRDLESKEAEYRACVRQYDDCITLSSGIDKLQDEQNSELMALRVAATRAEGDAAVVRENIKHLQDSINELNNDIQSIDSQLIVMDQLIESSEKKRDDLFAEYLKRSDESAKLEARYKEISETVAGQEQDIEARNREYVNAIEELTALKSNYSSFIEEKAIQSERMKSIAASLTENKERLNEENTNLAIYEGKAASLKQTMSELIEENNETLSQKLEAIEVKNGYESDIVKLNAGLGLAQGNLELQKSLKESYTTYQDAVQHLMQDAKHDSEVKSKILGVLAEVIKVPAEYVVAIDYALGGALQYVLCKDDLDARYLINYLKRKGYGRATFKPLSACRPRTLEGSSRAVLKEPGCLGLASDLIAYDSQFEPFISTLLGTTVIVNNMDNARLLFRKYNQAFKIVTLTGEVFSRTGEITGGSRRSNAQSLLSQEQNIISAEATVAKYKANLETMRRRFADKEQEIKECEEKLEQLAAKISELRIEIELNDSRAKQAAEAVERLNAEIADATEEYEKIKNTVAQIDEKLRSIDELERIAAERKDEYTSLYEESRTQGTQQRSEREELQSQVMQMRIALAGLNSEIDRAKGDISHHMSQRSRLEDEKLDAVAKLKAKQAELDSVAAEAENAAIPEKDAKRIKELESSLNELKERKLTLADDIKRLDGQKTVLFEAKNALSGKIIRNEAILDNVDIEIRNQQEHILEEYDLTYSSALELRQADFNSDAAPQAIAELKRAIGKLGDVNPLALEDLKKTEEHLAKQVAIRDDIQKAYDNLIEVIASITNEMKSTFLEAFNKINENFQVVFQQLFGGGNGELKLNASESTDVLEQGIDIFAQPPGKRLQNIGLLSGGEQALTAISILFAILKLKPMPFCVLDEIEAALDDANVNLFAEFLKKFSDFTQFIVITHRKPTMRHADTIFGVTMEEKGVTKIVSIEFEEAQKQAQ